MQLRWDKSLSVNCIELDEQHIILIDKIRNILEAVKSGADKSKRIELFNELMGLAAEHFETEEKYLAMHEYPGTISHRLEHKKVDKQAAEFRKILERDDAAITMSFAEFLCGWLMNHIKNVDLDYSRFIEQKRASSQTASAYLDENALRQMA